MDRDAANKLGDAGLRAFAADGDAGDVRSVIVELSVPPARLPPFIGKGMRPLPHAAAPPAAADVADHSSLMDDLEAKLQALNLPAKPVRLNAAEAFVLTVTPEQLRTLSAWPLVGAVRPNRTHRTPYRAAK